MYDYAHDLLCISLRCLGCKTHGCYTTVHRSGHGGRHPSCSSLRFCGRHRRSSKRSGHCISLSGDHRITSSHLPRRHCHHRLGQACCWQIEWAKGAMFATYNNILHRPVKGYSHRSSVAITTYSNSFVVFVDWLWYTVILVHRLSYVQMLYLLNFIHVCWFNEFYVQYFWFNVGCSNFGHLKSRDIDIKTN